MPGRLKTARRKAVGARETLRALEARSAVVVYVAVNADHRVVRSVIEFASRSGVEIVEVATMDQLGRACGIEVKAACAAISAAPPGSSRIDSGSEGAST